MDPKDYNSALVEYEEANATTRAYKFEVKQDRQGEWREAEGVLGAFYRVRGDRMQFYRFPESTPSAARGELESFIRDLDPVQRKGGVWRSGLARAHGATSRATTAGSGWMETR